MGTTVNRTCGTAALAALVAAGVLAVPAIAEPDFSYVQTLTGDRDAPVPPQVGMDARGNTIAAWAEGGDTNELRFAYRPVGGVFGPARTISLLSDVSGDQGLGQVSLAVSPAGDALVGWPRRSAGGARTFEVFYRPAGPSTTFGSAQEILPGRSAYFGRLAIGAGGQAALVLIVGGATTEEAWATYRQPGPAASFEPPQQLGENFGSVAVGPDGTALAASSTFDEVRVATHGASDSSFSAPAVVARRGNKATSRVSGGQLTMDRAGASMLTWSSQGPGSCEPGTPECFDNSYEQDAAFRPAGPATAFGAAVVMPFSPFAAILDTIGGAVVSGREFTAAGDQSVLASEAPFGGPFGSVTTIQAPGPRTYNSSLAAADGTFVLLWTSNGTAPYAVRTPASGRFTGRSPIGGLGGLAFTGTVTLATADEGAAAYNVYGRLAGTKGFDDPLGVRVAFRAPGHDAQAPQLFVDEQPAAGTRNRQRLGTDSALDVPVTCDEACNVSATATLSTSGGAARVYRLHSGTSSLGPGRPATLELKLPRAARKTVRRILRGGRHLSARVRLRAVDRSRNVRVATLSIRLRR